MRPAGNYLLDLSPAEQRRGVYTASSGNFGIAVARLAKQLGISASVVAPDNAPINKLRAVAGFGAEIHRVTYADWWDVIQTHHYRGFDGLFVSAESRQSMEGNGTIGLEILEQLPDVDAVLMSFGSGGLSCGIAAAIRAIKPDTRVIACETEAATPLASAWRAGEPVEVTHTPSFVTGMGSQQVLRNVWPLARQLLDDCAVVSLEQTAAAVRLILKRLHVVAEGAGAVPVAAALQGYGGRGNIVCVVSGGNLSSEDLEVILRGRVPGP